MYRVLRLFDARAGAGARITSNYPSLVLEDTADAIGNGGIVKPGRTLSACRRLARTNTPTFFGLPKAKQRVVDASGRPGLGPILKGKYTAQLS